MSESISNDNENAKICPRCVCMQSKLLDDDMISEKEIDIKSTLHKRWPSISKCLDAFEAGVSDVCHCCLGLLQDKFLDAVIEEITKTFNDQGYQCEDFKLSITLPVQSALFMENSCKTLSDAVSTIRLGGRGYSPKEVMKIYLEPILEKRLSLTAVTGNKANVDLDISVTVQHKDSENKLLPQLSERYPSCFKKAIKQNSYSTKKRKTTIYNAATIGNVMEVISAADLKMLIEPTFFANPVSIDDICMLRSPVYVGGRYCKMSRELSQTPWIVDGVRISEMSVEEYITLPIRKLFKADRCNFSTSGREDIDVRMLGNGRPFLVEIVNSRLSPSCDEIFALEKEINKSTSLIQVCNMSAVSKDDTKILKDGEEQKTKSYSALCYTKISADCPREAILTKLSELSQMKNIKIEQKTPIRVLHRRNLATREKEILTMNITVITVEEVLEMVSVNAKCADTVVPFRVEMTTKAGTYVKEFVHGDFGRTLPNLSSLIGSTTDILCLDVSAVNLEWPPER